ncbi:hypothetical protein RP20_CCG008685 [Aedes albopictus]|nr:hypothetical protein RP20_CCG008685 [Aedes albopictus]
MNHLPGSSPRSPAPSPDPDVDDGSSKKQATRVFKKSSSNGKITVYLGKRDFVDHITHVDPIDGVVLIDPDYVKDRKVFGHVLAAFRYGREDLDVLGLTFRKDLYLASEQLPGEAPRVVDASFLVDPVETHGHGFRLFYRMPLIRKFCLKRFFKI